MNAVLTKDMKIMLNKIISMEPEIQSRYYTFKALAANLTFDGPTFMALIEALDKEGYIQVEKSSAIIFTLQEKGKSYKAIQRSEFIDYFKKSIITPIVVSVLTTIATIIITLGFSSI